MPTITPPTALTITPLQDLMFAPMRAAELRTALANSNHLYGYFRPHMLSFMPFGVAQSSTLVFVVPVSPSQDGLTYDFLYSVLPSTTGTITAKVEKNTGTTVASGWSTIYGPTASGSLTGGAWAGFQHATVIPANVTMLRITLSAPAGTYLLSHIGVQPSAITSVTGQLYASGFIPFHDGLISGTGAPINTEHINRCRTNALAILTDRVQCLVGYVQPYSTSHATVGGAGVFTSAYHGTGTYQVTAPGAVSVTKAVGWGAAAVPGQTKLTAKVLCIASVTGGLTTGLVRVRALYANGTSVSCQLDASGNLETWDLPVTADGTQQATVLFMIEAKANVGQSTYIHSCVVLWRPGE